VSFLETRVRTCRRCGERKLAQAFGSVSVGEEKYCKVCLRDFDPYSGTERDDQTK
jgi:hypothetical protein